MTVEAIEGTKAGKAITAVVVDKKKERPPGAHPDENQFLSLCTGCDACMAACPVNVIMIEDLEKRDPLLFPDESPCIHCPGTPCITACPTGALNRKWGTLTRQI